MGRIARSAILTGRDPHGYSLEVTHASEIRAAIPSILYSQRVDSWVREAVNLYG